MTTTSGIHKTADHIISILGMSANPQTGALETPLTSVTPRSVSVGVGAELTPGALEAILTDAGPVAAEAIYALRAEAAPWAIRDTCDSEGEADAFASWLELELGLGPTRSDFPLLAGGGVILLSHRM